MLGAGRQWGQKRALDIVHLRRPQQARDSVEERSRHPVSPGRRASGAADTVRCPPARLFPPDLDLRTRAHPLVLPISHSSALHSETPAPCFWTNQQTVASDHLTGSSGHQIPASAFSAAPSAVELRAARMPIAQTRSDHRRQA